GLLIKMNQMYSVAPDIETASPGYALRFRGESGSFFLERQKDIVLSLIQNSRTDLRILEIGGGHAQLTPYLLEKGYQVWIQASSEEALTKARQLESRYPDRCTPFVSSLFELPFEADKFDIVIGLRLVCHVPQWEELLSEICRVAKAQVIIDYPPKGSFNLLYPLAFPAKKVLEGNSTRPFRRFRTKELTERFAKFGFHSFQEKREFFFPMVFHRLINRSALSRRLEMLCCAIGLTRFFGSPAVLSATDLLVGG
ncbi:MAG: class I SAM-dependent methyltransferase, partial [Bdellovibrionales bacterium]|nr:class I SAM-dependent methyltransferase [Bdellovibrionales bacterium]